MALTVAVVGCAHGELDDIYSTIEYINENTDRKVELLLCCGDFQAIRNVYDMRCMACPPKYHSLGTFYKYYNGEKKAPVMTIFIGGNHEASNYLQELHYGGWVAENIFYLGAAGVVQYGGVRIAGISGIFKQHDYTCGHFESYPYNNSTMRSVYHVREYEVFQLSHIRDPVDVFLSHDWPRGIEKFGNTQELLRKKPFFSKEVHSNTLGNPAGEYLLQLLKPSYWFSGHMHTKFAAIFRHTSDTTNSANQKETRFLALDKCLPNRDFLQVLSINRPEDEENKAPMLNFDPEWFAIFRATHHFSSNAKFPKPFPTEPLEITEADKNWIMSKVQENTSTKSDLMIRWPTVFEQTAKSQNQIDETDNMHATRIGNPQTDRILALLELPHLITIPYDPVGQSLKDPNSINIDESNVVEDKPMTIDSNEIDIDDI